MLGGDEYDQVTARPVEHDYAMGSSETNQNDTAMMEYMTEGDSVGNGGTNGDGGTADGGATGGHFSGGSWISQYDESCDEDDDDDDDEEHAEYSSLHPSPYTAQHFGISGDDDILKEDNINDNVNGVDNDEDNQNSDDSNDYDVYYYIGLYKFVQMISKSKPEESTENVVPDSTVTDDTTFAP